MPLGQLETADSKGYGSPFMLGGTVARGFQDEGEATEWSRAGFNLLSVGAPTAEEIAPGYIEEPMPVKTAAERRAVPDPVTSGQEALDLLEGRDLSRRRSMGEQAQRVADGLDYARELGFFVLQTLRGNGTAGTVATAVSSGEAARCARGGGVSSHAICRTLVLSRPPLSDCL